MTIFYDDPFKLVKLTLKNKLKIDVKKKPFLLSKNKQIFFLSEKNYSSKDEK